MSEAAAGCPLCASPDGLSHSLAVREVVAFFAGVGAGVALGRSEVLEGDAALAAQVGFAGVVEAIEKCPIHGSAMNEALLALDVPALVEKSG